MPTFSGAGLGLRRELLDKLHGDLNPAVDFMEVAPENWMNLGGRFAKAFRGYTERYPFICHGLSLSLGGSEPLDRVFLTQLKSFLKEHNIQYYSEHLSACSFEGHLYDLMPIPFTDDAVHYVAQRIREVQDILEQTIAIENVSYYAAPGQVMAEIDFINAVVNEANCELLLDVNNIYVNSINHGYDAEAYLAALPGHKAAYYHIAGHYDEADDLKVDTHGEDVIDPVWQLLESAYRQFGVKPTLLERDFNMPPIPQLLAEVDKVRTLQQRFVAAGNLAQTHG